MAFVNLRELKYDLFKYFPRRVPQPFSSIYHHHIGKTAGTYLNTFLREMLPPFSELPRPAVDQYTINNIRRAQFVTGHMPYNICELMPKPTLIISVLRDPVERLLSAYNHLYRSHGKHIFLQITRQGKPLSSINEFLDDQAIFPYTINPQLFSLGNPMSVPEIISRGKSLTRFSWQSPCTKSFNCYTDQIVQILI